MKHRFQPALLGLAVLSVGSIAMAAELRGTPEELRGYLQSETRTVTLRSEATETAYSDVAKVTLIISSKAKDLATAMKENNALRDSITNTLIGGDIEADDIKSSKYSASPQFGWFGNRPSSFEVVKTLIVTVSSDESFRRVAEVADRNDDVRFAGAEFEHSEKELYEIKVRDKALEQILKDQAYFEQKLGLELSPVAFNYSDVHAADNSRFGILEEIIVTGSRAKMSDMSTAAAPPPSNFDEIEYRVSVAVTFAIEKKRPN